MFLFMFRSNMRARSIILSRSVIYIFRFSEVHSIYLLFYDLRMQSCIHLYEMVTAGWMQACKSKYLFLADF